MVRVASVVVDWYHVSDDSMSVLTAVCACVLCADAPEYKTERFHPGYIGGPRSQASTTASERRHRHAVAQLTQDGTQSQVRPRTGGRRRGSRCVASLVGWGFVLSVVLLVACELTRVECPVRMA